MPFVWLYEVLRKSLQSFGIVRPMMWIALACNGIIVGLTYVLLVHTSVSVNFKVKN